MTPPRTAPFLGRWNTTLALAGLALLAAGYLALAHGPYTSMSSLTLAPLLLCAGYCVVLPLALIVDAAAGPRSLWPRGWRATARDPQAWVATLVGACALAVYKSTAAPTVTLWDSGELVAASRVLGITHPPGAPLYVLWGRLATMLPRPLDVAARVNLMSALFAAATAVMVALVLSELIQRLQQRQAAAGATTAAARVARCAGAAIGALVLAFSDAQWGNALEAELYAPYLFITTLVLWLLLRWVPRRRDRGADRLLLLAAYITGLALGVHVLHALALPVLLLLVILSNERLTLGRFVLLMAAGFLGTGFIYPGVVQWVPLLLSKLKLAGLLLLVFGVPLATALVVRRGGRARGVIAQCVVLVLLGFSCYATSYIRSTLDPPIDQNDPESAAQFRSYLGRQQYGRASITPRRAPLWDYQIKTMYVRYFGWQFFGKDEARGRDGRLSTLLSLKGLWGLPFLLGLLGMVVHFRFDWRHASAILALFLMLSLAVIVYVNHQDPQSRERDYSYTGSFMAFALWIGIGAAVLGEGVGRRLGAVRRSAGGGAAAVGTAVVCAVALALVPARMIACNYKGHDRSHDTSGYDFAYNLLSTCAPDAILLSRGDNATYPLWALQIVYGVRPDVTVVNLQMLNGPWYVKQLKHRKPGCNIAWTDGQIDSLTPIPWTQPRAVRIPVDASSADGLGAFHLAVAPSGPDGLLRPRDQIVLHLLSQNAFRRPVYLGPAWASELHNLELTPSLRNEGLAARLVPAEGRGQRIDRDLLRQNLLHRYRYDAYAYPEAVYDRETASLVAYLRAPFLLLAEGDVAAGDTMQAAQTLRQLDERIPEAYLPLQSAAEDLRIGRIEWLTGDRAGLRHRVLGVLRKYTLSPQESMTMASLLWNPLGERAAADSVAATVLSGLGKTTIDAQAVLHTHQQLLGSATGIDSVATWLHAKLAAGSGAR